MVQSLTGKKEISDTCCNVHLFGEHVARCRILSCHTLFLLSQNGYGYATGSRKSNHSEVSMGGIKNKLSRLSNKVKTLLSSLSLTEGADERSSSGEVKTNKTKGSRLPSFSQPSKMPDGQISNTRKLSHLGLYAEKTIGSLRPTSQSLPLAKGRQMSVAHRWGRIT